MKLVISKRKLYYAFIMLPFVRIEALVEYSIIDNIYDFLKVVTFVLLTLEYILRLKKTKQDKFFSTLLLLTIIATFSSIIHSAQIWTLIVRYMTFVSIILLIINVRGRREGRLFFSSVSKYFSLLIWINFIGLLLAPNGIYIQNRQRAGFLYDSGIGVHILGKANAVTPIVIAILLVILVNDYINHTEISKRGILYSVLSTINIILMGSSTGIIGIALFWIIFAMYKIKTLYGNKNINFKLLLAPIILMSAGVVLFNIQDYFSFIVSGLLGKDVTLTNRTNVWIMTFTYIKEKFSLIEYLVGSGLIDYRQEIFGGRYAHCHNQFLDQFIQTGIIGLLLYIRLLYLSISEVIKRYRCEINLLMILLGAGILSFTIMFIAEVYTTPMIILIMSISYNNFALIENR